MFLSSTLKDAHGDTEGTVEVRISEEKDQLGLIIHPQGMGTWDADEYAPIILEVYKGKVRLLVWADINQEECTHIIDLSGALITNRKDTETNGNAT